MDVIEPEPFNNEAVDMDLVPADEIKSEATLHFEIENVSKFNENMYSTKTMIRNLPWNIFITPHKNHAREDYISFFVQCNVDSKDTWSCKASLVFRVLSYDPLSSPNYEKLVLHHIFHNRENDWGFKQFISLQQLTNPLSYFVKDDRVLFEADVIADAPHGSGWNSKKFSGYVGLKNQGATCYMNSLLQIMYFTNRLRRFVYKMPTEGAISTHTLPIALQRIFYDLQFTNESVCIKNLINSFGWKPAEIFMQHDVQEFLRIILDKLENEMKGTSLEGSIPKLFEGKMKSFIRCVDVPYQSYNMETFYDIQLNVRDFKNVEQSLKNYTEIEILDGNNKFTIENYGPQTAEKGIHFLSFPPVLHLHLMRYYYDQKLDRAVKCNDHFEFSEKLNVASFLENADDKMDIADDPQLSYTLQAVLVHAGDNSSGHYFVYINPKCDGNWFKFDDEIVCQCKKSEAINDNYGGKLNDTANAYMLVYICDTEISNILENVTIENIPNEVLEKLTNDKRIEEEMCEENNFRVAIFTEEDLQNNPLANMFDYRNCNFKIFTIPKTKTYQEFYEFLKHIYNLQDPFYVFTVSTNSTELCYLNFNEAMSTALIYENFNINSQNPAVLFLFLTYPKMENAIQHFNPFDYYNDIILIIKVYYPIEGTVYLYKVHYYPKDTCFKDLIPIDLSFKDFKEYKIYLNSNDDLFQIFDFNLSIESLKNGDTLFFEPILENLPDGVVMPFPQFFDVKFHGVDVRYINKNKLVDKGFFLPLSLKTSYNEMVLKVAAKLDVDPSTLCFYENTKVVNKSIAKNFDGNVGDILKSSRLNIENIIFYEISHEILAIMPDADADQTWCTLEMEYLSADMSIQNKLIIACKPKDTVKDLLQKVCVNVKDAKRNVRLLCIMLKKIMFVVSEDKTVDFLHSLSQKHEAKDIYFRVEEIPDDQLVVKKSEMLIPVVHFDGELDKIFGAPFFIKLKNHESYESLRKRIQEKLNISKRNFRKYELSLIHLNEVIPITNELQIFNIENFRQARHQLFFGLNHSNTVNTKSSSESNMYKF